MSEQQTPSIAQLDAATDVIFDNLLGPGVAGTLTAQQREYWRGVLTQARVLSAESAPVVDSELRTGDPAEPREAVGAFVRQVWVEWAREQPNPKPSWLTPWEELDAGQREVDMRIGAALFEAGKKAAMSVVVDSDLRDVIMDALNTHEWVGGDHSNHYLGDFADVASAAVAPALRQAYLNGHDAGFAAANAGDPWAKDGGLQDKLAEVVRHPPTFVPIEVHLAAVASAHFAPALAERDAQLSLAETNMKTVQEWLADLVGADKDTDIAVLVEKVRAELNLARGLRKQYEDERDKALAEIEEVKTELSRLAPFDLWEKPPSLLDWVHQVRLELGARQNRVLKAQGESERLRAELDAVRAVLKQPAKLYDGYPYVPTVDAVKLILDDRAQILKLAERYRSELDALRDDAQAWQGHECEAGCTRPHVPPDGTPFGRPVTEASEQAPAPCSCGVDAYDPSDGYPHDPKCTRVTAERVAAEASKQAEPRVWRHGQVDNPERPDFATEQGMTVRNKTGQRWSLFGSQFRASEETKTRWGFWGLLEAQGELFEVVEDQPGGGQ